jgi:hypothetical protein
MAITFRKFPARLRHFLRLASVIINRCIKWGEEVERMGDHKTISGEELAIKDLTNMRKAETELLSRADKREIAIPALPINALRLLAEYWRTADWGFKAAISHPFGYAQGIHMLAFDLELAPSAKWPFTQQQMQASLLKSGLQGHYRERMPMICNTAALLKRV